MWTTISFCTFQMYLWWHFAVHLLDIRKLPYICWISESFNAFYLGPGMSPRMIGQTYCWFVLALCPAVEGLLLIYAWQRPSDWLAGILSSAYLLLVVFPDTLPHKYLFLHYGTAMVTMGAAVLFQFNLPWRCLFGTFSSYFVYYFSLSELCIGQGASRKLAYDWTLTPGVGTGPGSLVMVILEWALSFGGITVVISYCVTEIIKQKRGHISTKALPALPVNVAGLVV